MNGWAWLTIAAVLATAGVVVLVVAHRRMAPARPVRVAEPRTPPVEGDRTGPTDGGMFTPIVESTPAEIADYYRRERGQP